MLGSIWKCALDEEHNEALTKVNIIAAKCLTIRHNNEIGVVKAITKLVLKPSRPLCRVLMLCSANTSMYENMMNAT